MNIFKAFNTIRSIMFLWFLFSIGIVNLRAEPTSNSFENTFNKEGNVKVIRNIRYGNQPDGIGQDSSSDRTLDLYLPFNKKENLPVFVFIHGGGFSGGDKKSTEVFCSKISGGGFVVVSINYYLTLKHEKVAGVSCSAYMATGIPKDGFHPVLRRAIKNASEDTQKTLQWIKEHARKYHFDLSSIVLSGGSAGAMTALYTAYISEQKILPIGAVVNLWGGLEKPDLISKDAPPLLTFHGDQDKLINIDFAYAMQHRMAEIGNKNSKLDILMGKGHAMYKLINQDKVDDIIIFLKEALEID